MPNEISDLVWYGANLLIMGCIGIAVWAVKRELSHLNKQLDTLNIGLLREREDRIAEYKKMQDERILDRDEVHEVRERLGRIEERCTYRCGLSH